MNEMKQYRNGDKTMRNFWKQCDLLKINYSINKDSIAFTKKK